MRVRFSSIRPWFLPHTGDQLKPIAHMAHTPDEWLVRFHAILTQAGVRLTPLYGTCLGFFRDNRIIPGDTDADFGIALSDLPAVRSCVPALLAAGFYISGRGNYQLTFSMPNSSFYIDIWPYKALSFPLTVLGHRWLCDHVYYKADFFSNCQPFDYNGCRYYLPSPCEDYLETVFGANWRIPMAGCFSGPRGLISQWLNALFVEFPVPAAFSGEDSLGTYKPWVSKVLKTVCPNARIAQLFKHPEV